MHARTAKYTLAQREAMVAAYERLGVTGRDVVALAAAGELTHPNGAQLVPFSATESTVRSEARRARLRLQRAAALASVAHLPPRDAVERLRQGFCDRIDAEMTRIETEQAQAAFTGSDDAAANRRHRHRLEEIRQIARAIRELQAIPGPNEPRAPAPGAKRHGIRQGGETRGGLAGRLLRAVD